MVPFNAVEDVKRRSLVENYIVLGMRLGNITDLDVRPYFVDFYYGPRKLRNFNSVKAGRPIFRMKPEHCVAMAEALLERMDKMGEGMSQHRLDVMKDNLSALYYGARELAGMHIPYREKIRLFYGIDLSEPDLTPFQEAVESICSLRGCKRSEFKDSILEWYDEQKINEKTSVELTAALMKKFREKTSDFFQLPDGEMAFFVNKTGDSYSGYNWYHVDQDGNDSPLTSFCEANPLAYGFPYTVARNILHEAYPGHHTHHVMKENHLFINGDTPETCVAFLQTPEYTVVEGIAEYASTLLFTDGLSEVFEITNRILGRNDDPEINGGIADALEILAYTNSVEAFLLHVKGLTPEEVAEQVSPISYRTKEILIKRSTDGFISHPLFGAFVQTYRTGSEMVRQAIKAGGNDVLQALYSERHTPRTLSMLTE